MVQDLRQMIREILVEELSAHRSGSSVQPEPVRREFVAIHSDADLARFTERLLRLAADSRGRADIQSGRHVFLLERASQPGAPADVDQRVRTGGQARTFSTGLITEKQIHQLPADVKVVSLGQGAVLTPLAKDAVRQAGIKIERVKK